MSKDPPVVSMKLTYKDLAFIYESIAQNVPADEHRTTSERETVDKVLAALARVRRKE